MKAIRLFSILTLWPAVCLLSLSSTAGELVIDYVSDPLMPDETGMVTGWRFAGDMQCEVARLVDGAPGRPGGSPVEYEPWQTVQPVQVTDNSLKLVMPSNLRPGAYACRVSRGDVASVHVINTPDPWWVQGDEVGVATHGGWLRVFGKCLSFDNASPSVVLTQGDRAVKLVLKEVTPEALWAKIDNAIEPGTYEVHVHNGFGGPGLWRRAGSIDMGPGPQRKQDVFDVRDFGAAPADAKYLSWDTDPEKIGKVDSSEAIQRALDAAGANGGGVVFLPRGGYLCTRTLNVPKFVTLRGAGRGSTGIEWTDCDPPRSTCIKGTSHFGVEDISLYALNHYAVIFGNSGRFEDSGSVKIRRVLVRADRFVTCESPRHYPNYKEIFEQRLNDHNRIAALTFGGENIEIIDSDIYSSRLVLGLDKVSGRIAGNRFTATPTHWSLFVRGVNRMIFENNYSADGGASLSSVHHFPHFDEKGVRSSRAHTTNARAVNLYCAHNDLRDSWRRDRDGGFNSDYHGPVGLYLGHIKTIAGTRVELEGRFYGDREPGDEWLGVAISVVDGKGRGQYRSVVGFEGANRLVIDRPFRIDPDPASWVSVHKAVARQIYVDNTISDAGNGVFFWCGGIESIAARNEIVRAGTVNVNSIWHTGLLPAIKLQFNDNVISEGLNYGASYIHLRGGMIGAISYPPAYAQYPGEVPGRPEGWRTDARAPDYRGAMTMLQTIRGNTIRNNGRYYVGGLVSDCVLEHNTVSDADVGIEITRNGGRWEDWFEGGPSGILLRANTMRNVERPLAGDRLDEAEVID